MFGLLGYLVAGAGSLWSSEHKSGRVMVSVAGGAVLLHLSGLVLWSLRVGHLPLTGSADTFASLALLVGVGGLYARRLPRMALLEGLLTPMAAVLLALGLILPVGDVLREPEGAWLVVHIAGMVMGVAGFALSFGASVAWFQVRRRLKSKRLEGLGRLPSMDQLDRLNTRFTLFGFAALTVGISGGGSGPTLMVSRTWTPPSSPRCCCGGGMPWRFSCGWSQAGGGGWLRCSPSWVSGSCCLATW